MQIKESFFSLFNPYFGLWDPISNTFQHFVTVSKSYFKLSGQTIDPILKFCSVKHRCRKGPWSPWEEGKIEFDEGKFFHVYISKRVRT